MHQPALIRQVLSEASFELGVDQFPHTWAPEVQTKGTVTPVQHVVYVRAVTYEPTMRLVETCGRTVFQNGPASPGGPSF
jgi:hypothetical protein